MYYSKFIHIFPASFFDKVLPADKFETICFRSLHFLRRRGKIRKTKGGAVYAF